MLSALGFDLLMLMQSSDEMLGDCVWAEQRQHERRKICKKASAVTTLLHGLSRGNRRNHVYNACNITGPASATSTVSACGMPAFPLKVKSDKRKVYTYYYRVKYQSLVTLTAQGAAVTKAQEATFAVISGPTPAPSLWPQAISRSCCNVQISTQRTKAYNHAQCPI